MSDDPTQAEKIAALRQELELERTLKKQAIEGMQALVSRANAPDALTVVIFPDAQTKAWVSWAVEPDIMSGGRDREHALEMMADALRALARAEAKIGERPAPTEAGPRVPADVQNGRDAGPDDQTPTADPWAAARALCDAAFALVPEQHGNIWRAIERASWRLGDRDAAAAEVHLVAALRIAGAAGLLMEHGTGAAGPWESPTDLCVAINRALEAVRTLRPDDGDGSGVLPMRRAGR